MRIVYVHQYYKNRGRPGSTRSYELARRLVDQGHQVDVVTSATEGGDRGWAVELDDGIRVHRVPVPYGNAMSYSRRVRAFAQFAVLASARALRLRPDLVLATSTPLTVAVPGVLAARRHRVPFVFEVRDLWPELPVELGALRNPLARRAAFLLARTAYRNAAEVIALSPGMADGVAAHGFPREHITVIPNGSDLDLFSVDPARVVEFRAAHDWLGDRPLVLYAGHVSTANGVDYLVRLATEVRRRDPDVRFLVVGYGRDFDRVRAFAEEASLAGDSVHFLPGVAKEEMPVLLGAATLATSLFLPVPGLRNNSPNKVFDAFAAGRPLAVNHGGWLADLLRESGAGLVLPHDDLPAAADQLVAAVRDEEWVARAARSSRVLAETCFSRELQFVELEKVLSKASGQHSPGAARGRGLAARVG